jgi:hypothetical protein
MAKSELRYLAQGQASIVPPLSSKLLCRHPWRGQLPPDTFRLAEYNMLMPRDTRSRCRLTMRLQHGYGGCGCGGVCCCEGAWLWRLRSRFLTASTAGSPNENGEKDDERGTNSDELILGRVLPHTITVQLRPPIGKGKAAPVQACAGASFLSVDCLTLLPTP